MEKLRIGCVVMAAGNASRFGRNKLAAEVDGKTLLRRALEAVPPGRFCRVAVVTQYPEAAEAARRFSFTPVKNRHPDWGISHTISLGLDALGDCDAALFLVSDQPLLEQASVAELLDFPAITQNSLDGVSDRDFLLDYLSAASLCMMHLSRFCEELILWNSSEFHFVEMDDAFSTGSSIMPQKKNPDVTELIRGKTGRVYGDLNTLLVMMKGIPLAYNKDMQEDKEAIFDAVDTLELCLKTVTPMLDTMKTIPANMRRAAAKGFINATDCADYLTKKGMPFRDAYKLTGCMVSDCIAKDKTLEELTLDEFKGYSGLFEKDIYEAIDLVKCCEGRTSYGGPSEASVKNQIALAAAQLTAWEEKNA